MRRWLGLASGVRKKFQVCIVGSGPAGIYSAQNLLKKVGATRDDLDLSIDVLDRRPTPGGLARYGVAPDHAPSVSAVLDTVDTILSEKRVRFFGNVQVKMNGEGSIGLHELRSMYDAVILAHGADKPNWLGIKGEGDLKGKGVMTARDLVAFYCGDPMMKQNPFEFSAAAAAAAPMKIRDVAVVGAGNVALDVARMLLSPPDLLRLETDTAGRFVDLLQSEDLGGIQRVHVLARRGPRSAAFAPRELREVLSKKSYINTTVVLPDEKEGRRGIQPFDDVPSKEQTRAQKRVFKLLRDCFESQKEARKGNETKTGQKELFLHFLHKPVEFTGEDHLQGVRVELQQEHGGSATEIKPIEGDEKIVELPVQLAIVAASQQTVGLDGLPPETLQYKERLSAKALSGSSQEGDVTLAPVYLCGWANHGAKGIIGASMVDADEVSRLLIDDICDLDRPRPDQRDLGEVLSERGTQVLSEVHWNVIKGEQRQRGKMNGRASEMITDTDEMLALAGKKGE